MFISKVKHNRIVNSIHAGYKITVENLQNLCAIEESNVKQKEYRLAEKEHEINMLRCDIKELEILLDAHAQAGKETEALRKTKAAIITKEIARVAYEHMTNNTEIYGKYNVNKSEIERDAFSRYYKAILDNV